jgi:hypothetical protein
MAISDFTFNQQARGRALRSLLRKRRFMKAIEFSFTSSGRNLMAVAKN